MTKHIAFGIAAMITAPFYLAFGIVVKPLYLYINKRKNDVVI